MMQTYATIVKKAKMLKQGVEKEYKLTRSSIWSYYIAKQILNPKKDVKKITVNEAKNDTGDGFSRQVTKSQYLDMANRLVKYVESNNRLPNNIKLGGKVMRVRDYTYMFARIIVYYDDHKALPKYAEVNSKAFTKPSEYPNDVYAQWVKSFGFKPKYIDDVCDYILKHFTYQFYYDDHKSNAEVIKSKSGNCTDLSQMSINMGEAMGYEWKAIHVKCNRSGTGHIYPMFRKKGVNNGNWFIRDVACISDESRYCIWCEANNGGTKLAENPSWFMQNLRR